MASLAKCHELQLSVQALFDKQVFIIIGKWQDNFKDHVLPDITAIIVYMAPAGCKCSIFLLVLFSVIRRGYTNTDQDHHILPVNILGYFFKCALMSVSSSAQG